MHITHSQFTFINGDDNYGPVLVEQHVLEQQCLDIIDDGMQPVFHIVILLEEIKLVFFIPTQAFFFWVDSLFISGK